MPPGVLLDVREHRPCSAARVTRNDNFPARRIGSGEALGIKYFTGEVAERGTPAPAHLAIPMHQANGFAYQ